MLTLTHKRSGLPVAQALSDQRDDSASRALSPRSRPGQPPRSPSAEGGYSTLMSEPSELSSWCPRTLEPVRGLLSRKTPQPSPHDVSGGWAHLPGRNRFLRLYATVIAGQTAERVEISTSCASKDANAGAEHEFDVSGGE